MNTRLNFPVKSALQVEGEDSRQAMIQAEMERKKAQIPLSPKPDLSKMGAASAMLKTPQAPPLPPPVATPAAPTQEQAIPEAPTPTPQQEVDIMKIMSGTAKDIAKFASSSTGMRTISAFVDPYTAIELNKKADQKEAQETAKAIEKVKAQNKYKPEYIKKVGIFDPNTRQIIPGTSPKDLGEPTLDPEVQFKQEKDLRDKFQPLTSDFRTVRDAFTKVKIAAKDPSAAGDLALIFNYMKTLDPGSVVRESEFKNAAATGAYGERLKAAASLILEGKRLSPVMRADFLDRAKRLFKGQETQYDKTSNEYRKLAKAYKLDPKRVVLDLGIAKDAPAKDFAGHKEQDLSPEEKSALKEAGLL